MTPPPDFRLITLGRVALMTPAGEDADLGRRRRKLALLAVLALSPVPLTRATLAEMFWGDEDEDRARHSLSDALSDLRRVLGRDAISGRSEIVQLDNRGRLAIDAVDMEAAFTAGDFARVRSLYDGPFLGNLSVDGSPGFEKWIGDMRERYASMHARALAAQVTVGTADVASPAPGRRLAPILLGTAVAAALIGFAVAKLPASDAPATDRSTPVIALTDVFTDPADTSLSWLAEGLKQMIAADLGRVSSAGVVAPAVVREAALDAPRHDSLSASESIAIAKRLHAGWAASASVLRRQGSYVVNITLRDVEHSAATRTFVVSGDNILVVADQAAAKMLSALDAHGTGPRLSDVETGNTDAYRHFIRSEEMRADGRGDEQLRELDAAIAADSGFTSAIVSRLMLADAASYKTLRPLFERTRARMLPWDVMSYEVFEATHSGDPLRAERIAREQVAKYPRDPRSIRVLAELQTLHGAFQAAETTYTRLVALDASAPNAAGPCWTCEAYHGLSTVRHLRGDYAGEIDVARKWTALRPASGSAWLSLANSLTLAGDIRAAEPAFARYRQLSDEGAFDEFTGRMLVMARRLDEAEEYARRFPASNEARDLLASVQRERGQYRAAVKTYAAWRAAGPMNGSELVYAHTLGALHDDARVRTIYEHVWHPPTAIGPPSMYGPDARGYTWNHVLEADALWTHADTAVLRALADSIQRIGKFSYYSRDWSIYHHVRGLVAERAGRLAEARAELEQALAPIHGFTRTNVELARVNVALGDPSAAIDVLRRAYHEPVDAMGRYATRSEMDYQMSLAFAKARQPDSARTYASYVRAAWVHADAEFARRLAELP